MALAEKSIGELPDLEKRVRGIFRYNKGLPVIQIPDKRAYNPGGIKFKDIYYLLVRVQDRDPGFSSLILYKSADGIKFKKCRDDDCIPFSSTAFTHRGKEDARINPVDGGFAITFTPYSEEHGPCVGLVWTEDFETFEDKGVILPPSNKDAIVFPYFPDELIDKRHVLHHRPTKEKNNAIWSCRSPDLKHWGSQQVVLEPDKESRWYQERVGAGAPPLKTKEGYISIIHGVNNETGKCVYSAGTLLTALNDPSDVIRVSENPLLAPETEYEKGEKKDVVFPTAAILELNGQVKIYYGAGDRHTCVAFVSLDYLLEHALYN